MARVAYPHIEETPKGVAYVSGTQTKVIESHWMELPTTETPTRFKAASSLEPCPDLRGPRVLLRPSTRARQIEEQIRSVEQSRVAAGESPVRAKLRAMGRLR